MKFLYDLAMQHYGSVVGDEQHMADVIKRLYTHTKKKFTY